MKTSPHDSKWPVLMPISPIARTRLDDLSALIEASLPIAGAELASLLLRQQLASREVSLRELAEIFSERGRTAPFRILRRKGVEVAVPPGGVSLATTVLSTAAHAVSSWGIAMIDAIAERVATLTSERLSLDFAIRALTSAPGFRWLDETNGWFTFEGGGSRLEHVIQKVFSVSPSVRFDELRGAIVKALPMTLAVPAHVLREYLRIFCRCELRRNRVSVPPSQPSPHSRLTPVERKITALLRAVGGTLALSALRDMAEDLSTPWRAIGRALRSSPLFVIKGRARVCLVGAT